MAVDRGSLRYTIDLESQAAITGLGQFRASLDESRESWRRFRAEISSTRRSTRTISRELSDLATQTRRASEATESQTRAAERRRLATRSARRETERDTQASVLTARVLKRLTDANRELNRARTSSARSLLRLNRDSVRAARTEEGILRQQVRAAERLAIAKRQAGQGRDVRTGELRAEQQKRQLLEAQNDLERSQTSQNNRQLQQVRSELAVSERLLRVEQQRLQAQLLRSQGRIASGAQAGLSVDEAAAQRFNEQLERLQIEEVTQRLQRANPEFQRLQRELRGAGRESGRTGNRFRLFNSILDRTNNRANRIAFTFRRLIGIFAAFAAIRTTIQLFNDLVRSSVRFNAAIEQSILGVASLFTATGQVATASGEAVDAVTQLELAQREARRQVNLLRRDALVTTATFQELRDAFQVAIAPGVNAGLDIGQIREFSVRISQAASAIGLAGNQLSEEIRSILSGTIQQRTTRIAAALGITNEDIRRAREAGVLAEFLEDRFRAFEVAGQESLTLFNAVVARLRDGFEELLRQGSTEFFEDLKLLLGDIFDGLVQINDEGLEINPDAVEIVRLVFDGLRRAVAEARRLTGAADLSNLRSAAEGIGNFIGTSAEIIGAIIEGFIDGAQDLAEILRPLRNLLTNIFETDDLQGIVREATRLLTIWTGITLAIQAAIGFFTILVRPVVRVAGLASQLFTSLGGVQGILPQILSLFRSIRTVVGLLLSPIGLLVSGLGFVVFEAIRISDEVFDIGLRFGTLARIVRTVLVNAFDVAAAAVTLNFQTVYRSLRNGFRTVAQGIRETIFGVLETGLEVADNIPGVNVEEELNKLRDSREESRQQFKDQLEEDNQKIRQLAERLRVVTQQALRNAQIDIGAALATNQNAETAEEFVNRIREEIASGFSGLFEDSGSEGFSNDLDEAGESVTNLLDELENIPGILERSSTAVQGLEDTFRTLADDLARAQGQLSISLDTQGLEGITSDIRTSLAERRVQLAEQELGLNRAIESQQNAVVAAQARASQLAAETAANYSDSVEQIDNIVELSRALVDQNTDILQAENRLASLRSIRSEVATEGRDGLAEALDNDIRAQEENIASLRRTAELGRGAIQTLLTQIGAVGDERLVELVAARVRALGEEEVKRRELQRLDEERIVLEERVNEITLVRLQAIAAAQRAQSQERLSQLNAELEAQRRVSEFEGVLNENNPNRALAQAEADLIIEQEARDRLQRRAEAQRQANQANIQELIRIGATEEQIEQTKRDQFVVQQALVRELQLQNEAVETASDLVDEERRKLEQPVSFGLQAGFQDFLNDTADQFQSWREIGLNTVRGFADTVSGLLTAAFDPRRAVNVREAFGEFFLSITNQLIQNLVNRSTAALLSSTTSLFGFGFASGGQIPGRGIASSAHFLPGVQGLAGGGAVRGKHQRARRPSNVDSRDTVPIWSQAGEYMMQLRAVAKYGLTNMQAINDGVVDPMALSALVGSRSAAITKPTAPSFVGGGLVSEQLQEGNRLAASAERGAQQRSMLQRAVLVADEETMERLLAGGPEAQRRWLEENSQDARISLGS